MRTKALPARWSVDEKATQGSADEGTFTALVAVFNNVDLGGDRIVKGAFTDTLADWQARGDPIPVIWSHEASDPFSHVGEVDRAEETDEGLKVTGRLDLDAPKAAQVWRLLKGRRVTQFSFAYDVLDADLVTDPDGNVVHELRSLRLYEVGPTLVGMNPSTELLAAKSYAKMLDALASHDAERDAILDAARAALAGDDPILDAARRASAEVGTVL